MHIILCDAITVIVLEILFGSHHVIRDSWCDKKVEWPIMSYNTLVILRVTLGARFMLAKITKVPSKRWLTTLLVLGCSGLTN
jgi:hypothetical protein